MMELHMKKYTICMLFSLVLAYTDAQREGDRCVERHTNTIGTCRNSEQCQSAKNDHAFNGIQPTFCSHSFSSTPLVCCRDGANILQTVAPKAPESAPVWGNSGTPSNSGTVAGSDRRRLSERKCEEYSRQVIETVDFIALLPDPETMSISAAKCDYTGVELIVGGENAVQGEFPHMAAVGWIDVDDNYAFQCGGSLISSRFVLTAGHCTRNPRMKDPVPSIVRLGDQNIDPRVNDGANPVDVPIKTIHKHPNYKPPNKYHDIALFELMTDVDFETTIRPACLWTKPGFMGHSKAIATGWGVTDPNSNKISNELKKVSLSLMENNYCGMLLRGQYRNWDGFIPSQMCAGELRGGKDTCHGDSGSPLQVASKENQCIFHVIGITSFGIKCAKTGKPAIYTRVSSYLDWIEGVVWPGES